MPKIIRTPRRKYIPNAWANTGYPELSMLCDYGLLRRDESYYFLNSPYLRELYENLHTNMLYNWLQGEYGWMDSATIGTEDIAKVWRKVADDHGYFTRGGIVMNFYIDKELKFWQETLK